MEVTAIHPPKLDLHDAPGAAAMRRAWRDLSRHATLPTQSPQFVEALRASYLAGEELALFHVESEGRFDAVLPMVRKPGYRSRWRLAGDVEVYEPGDALCRNAGAAERLATLIARKKRPIVLARVPATSPLLAAIRKAMRGRGLVAMRPAVGCLNISLDPSWSDPESKFNSRRRSDFRRALRRAGEFGEVDCETLAPSPEEFEALFDEAVRVEAASWKRDAGTAIACDPVKEDFFRRYLRAACEAGECRISFLRLGGKVAAMQLAVDQLGRRWLFKIGFDETFQRCSPGTILMLHAIGAAAAAGCASFEMMGEAESWIAELWTRDEHPCVQLRTYPFSLQGFGALTADCLAWARARIAR